MDIHSEMSAEEIRKQIERANFEFMFDEFFERCIADIDRLLGNLGKCECGRDAVKRCECGEPICDVCCYSISGEPERKDCGGAGFVGTPDVDEEFLREVGIKK